MGEPLLLRLVALVAFAGTYLGLGLGRVPGFRVDRIGIAIIGATISRSIVEAHGGRLWATANVPHGAVFQFTLPMGADKVV